MAQPTETELLVLNSIIYTSSFTSKFEGGNVYEWACEFNLDTIIDDSLPGEINKEEFRTILNTIKANKNVYSKMIIKDVNTDKVTSKKNKSLYVTNASIEYGDDLIIIYKGTGGPLEWRDNGEGGYSNITDTEQQKKALEYFDSQVFDKNQNVKIKGNIYVTGHSKGGNKAQYVGVLRGELINHIYSFDGQGFGQAFLIKYKDLIEENSSKITSISNEYDFVNILFFSIAGERKYIKSNTSWGSNPDLGPTLVHKFLGVHSPYSIFKLDKEGNVELNERVDQSGLMREIQGWVAHYARYMNEEDWRFLCYNIMSAFMDGEGNLYGDDYSIMPDGFGERLVTLTKGYIEKNKGLNFGEVHSFLMAMSGLKNLAFIADLPSESYAIITRDFSDTTKQNLLSIVEEVDDEPWYDVTRWDIFYRIDDLLGDMDFPSNQDALSTYYRKIIDMQGVSKKKINQIFEEVYQADNQFANQMDKLNDRIVSINNKLTMVLNKFKI